MRNLKRALSLALAAVMVLGLMIVGAGAADVYDDFTDTDEIVHTEAVQTMVALNVIEGKEDGSYFDPTGTLTRSEMAKIVAYVMNGGVEPVMAIKPIPTYSDIDGHWAESYIEYCTSMNIIAGDGAGKFNPEGTLTASQTAKMFLTAMGYNAEVFGLTGVNWEINTNRYANEAGLYEGLGNVSPSDPISRDDAAQMAYNAIQSALMIRGWSQDVTTGTVTETYTLAINDEGEAYRTLFSERFGGKIFIGTFRGNYDTGASATNGEINVYGKLDTDSATDPDRSANFPSDLSLEGIGEEYKVLFKDGTSGVANTPDRRDTIYGVFKTGATTVYNITKADLQDAGSDNLSNGRIKFGDATYTMAATLNVVENYGASTSTISGSAAAAGYVNNNTTGLRVNSTDPIKLVCNDDGEIYYAYVTNTITAEVTALTSTNVQLAGQTSKSLEDCEGFDSVAVGDIVRFADLYPTATRTTQFIEEAQVVEGEILAFNTTGSAVQIDGTWYKYNGHNRFVDGDYTAAALTAANVGDTVSLIMDGGQFYGAYRIISGYNDYAVITWADDNLGVDSVRALLADGSTSVYEFSDTSGITSSEYTGTNFSGLSSVQGATSAALYAYELESNNTKIRLTRPVTQGNTDLYGSYSGGSYNADNMTLSVSGTYIVSPDASVFLYGGSTPEWRTYTASDLASFTLDGSNSQMTEYIVRDGRVVALKGYVNSLPTAGSNSVGYGYVTDRVTTRVNDSNVTMLTVWDGTDSIELYVDGTSTQAYRGDFIRYPIVADGAVVSVGDVLVEGLNGGSLQWTPAKIKSYNSSTNILITTTETIDGTGAVVGGTDYSYRLTSDTKIIGVDTANRAGSTVNSLIAYTKTVGADYNNAYIVAEYKNNSYYEVLAVFIDEDNKLTEYTGGNTPGSANGAATSYSVSGDSETKNGVTVTVTPDITSAVNGQTITFTVRVSGTATASSTFTISGVSPTLSGNGTNCTINNTTITITNGAVDNVGTATSGTWTFTVTCSGAVSVTVS